MLSLVVLRVFVVVLLVAANAFFVAAEFALVNIRDTRIQELIAAHRIGSRTVLRLHHNLPEVLAAVQFGVTLCSVGLGWLGEATIAHLIQAGLGNVPHAALYAHGIGIGLAFATITYLLITLGELVPKSVALGRVERVAIAVATPLDVFITVSRPFLYLVNHSAQAVLRMFGMRRIGQGAVHSTEELRLIVTSARQVGILPEAQEEMIHRALELGDVTVREIMVPRPDIFSLPANMTLDDALSKAVEAKLSRIPIYDPERGPEHIVGMLYIRDLVRLMYLRMKHGALPPLSPGSTRLRHIMRDVLVVPETKPVSDLLVEFRERKRHLAVVVDEFGSTAGVVTVEDVLRQIVGEMEDEYDAAKEPPLAAAGPSAAVLDGSENIHELEIEQGLKLPRDEGFETLAGFVMARLQRIPKRGDSFEYQGHRFTVLEMDGHRIAEVKIEPVDTRQAQAGD
ncbi:MAG TPA: hemolysin family protein [Terriglobales bacterium]|jgi:CBS domain containing-hemolysin-like protein|nr:hemolysin family protein [Terriglobales bacterium]